MLDLFSFVVMITYFLNVFFRLYKNMFVLLFYHTFTSFSFFPPQTVSDRLYLDFAANICYMMSGFGSDHKRVYSYLKISPSDFPSSLLIAYCLVQPPGFTPLTPYWLYAC